MLIIMEHLVDGPDEKEKDQGGSGWNKHGKMDNCSLCYLLIKSYSHLLCDLAVYVIHIGSSSWTSQPAPGKTQAYSWCLNKEPRACT